MKRHIETQHEDWPLARPFRISRGTRKSAPAIVVSIGEGAFRGRGEACPYARYGESVPGVLGQIASVAAEIEAGAGRQALLDLLPAGAARNAIDCALWDLEAKLNKKTAAELAGADPGGPILTARTVAIDTPEKMAHAASDLAASELAGAPVLKIKLDAERVVERLAAVRKAAPEARLIVDANESWDAGLLAGLMKAAAGLGVELIEQPLPAGEDQALSAIDRLVPVCADESCHTSADLARLSGLYDFINIKLDKSGGLTEALALAESAKAQGFGILVGCMICTSLAIAPAMLLTGYADFTDLDGPWWLEKDRANPVAYRRGRVILPEAGLWGDPG